VCGDSNAGHSSPPTVVSSGDRVTLYAFCEGATSSSSAAPPPILPDTVRITETTSSAATKTRTLRVVDDSTALGDALAPIAAHDLITKILDCMDKSSSPSDGSAACRTPAEARAEIVSMGLHFGIATRFTTFAAGENGNVDGGAEAQDDGEEVPDAARAKVADDPATAAQRDAAAAAAAPMAAAEPEMRREAASTTENSSRHHRQKQEQKANQEQEQVQEPEPEPEQENNLSQAEGPRTLHESEQDPEPQAQDPKQTQEREQHARSMALVLQQGADGSWPASDSVAAAIIALAGHSLPSLSSEAKTALTALVRRGPQYTTALAITVLRLTMPKILRQLIEAKALKWMGNSADRALAEATAALSTK
jgi:hypothetical protein